MKINSLLVFKRGRSLLQIQIFYELTWIDFAKSKVKLLLILPHLDSNLIFKTNPIHTTTATATFLNR
ncbi:hypothetical protein CPR19088_GLDEOEPO_02060 [Companilactobacillus paralimentarius]|nr:hypothetical protein LNA01_26200 [Companilactobacillus nantensis]